MLGQNDNMAQGEAVYNAGLTGDTVYEAYDLCEVTATGLAKVAANPVAATRFCQANTDHAQPYATAIYRARPAWYRRIATEDIWVLGLAVAWAENLRGVDRDLVWNATDKVLEVAGTTGATKVRILQPIFELNYAADPGTGFTSDAQQRPEVGDIRVPVAVHFTTGSLV